jgi:hypothetical protein
MNFFKGHKIMKILHFSMLTIFLLNILACSENFKSISYVDDKNKKGEIFIDNDDCKIGWWYAGNDSTAFDEGTTEWINVYLSGIGIDNYKKKYPIKYKKIAIRVYDMAGKEISYIRIDLSKSGSNVPEKTYPSEDVIIQREPDNRRYFDINYVYTEFKNTKIRMTLDMTVMIGNKEYSFKRERVLNRTEKRIKMGGIFS